MYDTKAFRRGRAVYIQKGGGRLKEILEAGDWMPPACMHCLKVSELEQDVVLEAHIEESSGDEDRAGGQLHRG